MDRTLVDEIGVAAKRRACIGVGVKTEAVVAGVGLGREAVLGGLIDKMRRNTRDTEESLKLGYSCMTAEDAGAMGGKEGAGLLVIEDHHTLNPYMRVSVCWGAQDGGDLAERCKAGSICLIIGVRRGGCGESALPA
jgi:hypothetical protein